MKTALQQYIDRLEEMLQAEIKKGEFWKDKSGPWLSHSNTTVNTLRNTISEAKQFLPTERQIIEDAFIEGRFSAASSDTRKGTDYFNQTFNTQP